jgi:hypothetical protein
MLFCDLLRVTVLLVAGVATALGAVTVVIANQDRDSLTLIVAAVWWSVAAIGGALLGLRARCGEDGDEPPP